jgi:hypothetical protein
MRLVRILAVAPLLLVLPAHADDLYRFRATMNGTTSTFGFQTTQETIDAFANNRLSRYVAGYTGAEAVDIAIDYRGLTIQTAFPNAFGGSANYTELRFVIPSLGIARSFAGTDRDDSAELLFDYLKSSDLLGQISKKLVAVSPVDPVAGNPNSMMSQMVANDFASGMADAGGKGVPAQAGKEGNPNLLGLGLRFGQYRQADIDSKSVTLPFSYTIRSDIDPRRQLVINLPVSRTEVQGSNSYYAGVGLAYRLPMNDAWTLTPSGNYAVTGSKDLGSMAQMASASLTSAYVFELSSMDLTIGNMVGYYKTLKFSHDGYSYDPGIANTVFRNGLMLSSPLTLFGKAMSIEYAAIDTRFTGSELYLNNYHELSVTLGTNRSASSARSFLRAGASYLFSPKSKGLTLNLGYWF